LSSGTRLLALACAVCVACPAAWAQGDALKGQYLAKAAGCAGCHTDNQAGAQPYAGGREIATPLGKFYGPNLTPHAQAGLGRWTLQDFRKAIRFGERPDESAWRALAGARSPAALLEAARSCGLRRWTAGLDASCDSHLIEISLRARWRECILELSSWMPAEWRPATLWFAGLVDLPALCHLVRGEPPLPWMRLDPMLRTYCVADAGERRNRLMQDALAFMESRHESHPAVAGNVDAAVTVSVGAAGEDFESRVRRMWYEQWRRLWPARREAGAFARLVAIAEAGYVPWAKTAASATRSPTSARCRMCSRPSGESM
jgi:hypothetical protein